MFQSTHQYSDATVEGVFGTHAGRRPRLGSQLIHDHMSTTDPPGGVHRVRDFPEPWVTCQHLHNVL
jgi:hypothetical protein